MFGRPRMFWIAWISFTVDPPALVCGNEQDGISLKELTNRFPALLHIVYQQLIWWNSRLHPLILFSIFLLQEEFWLVNIEVRNTKDKLHRTQKRLLWFTVAWWKGKQQHTKWLSSNTRQHFHLLHRDCKPNVPAVSFTQDYLGVGKSFKNFFKNACASTSVTASTSRYMERKSGYFASTSIAHQGYKWNDTCSSTS